jgi:hypothetical protein
MASTLGYDFIHSISMVVFESIAGVRVDLLRLLVLVM